MQVSKNVNFRFSSTFHFNLVKYFNEIQCSVSDAISIHVCNVVMYFKISKD